MYIYIYNIYVYIYTYNMYIYITITLYIYILLNIYIYYLIHIYIYISVNARVGRLLAPFPFWFWDFHILGSQIHCCEINIWLIWHLAVWVWDGLGVWTNSALRKLGPRQPKYLVGCGMLLRAWAPAESDHTDWHKPGRQIDLERRTTYTFHPRNLFPVCNPTPQAM